MSITSFFGGAFFGGEFFNTPSGPPPDTPTGALAGGSWHHLGPARFKKYRDERHPEEVKKRLQEAFEKATGELATVAQREQAVAAIEPYAPTLRDLAPGKLQGLAPELPPIDWQAVAERIDSGHAARLLAIENQIEEEEHALMHLLLND